MSAPQHGVRPISHETRQGWTANATEFVKANKRSPVVSGSAIGMGGEGCIYELKNGQTFTLTRDECAMVGVPRWLGD